MYYLLGLAQQTESAAGCADCLVTSEVRQLTLHKSAEHFIHVSSESDAITIHRLCTELRQI